MSVASDSASRTAAATNRSSEKKGLFRKILFTGTLVVGILLLLFFFISWYKEVNKPTAATSERFEKMVATPFLDLRGKPYGSSLATMIRPGEIIRLAISPTNQGVGYRNHLCIETAKGVRLERIDQGGALMSYRLTEASKRNLSPATSVIFYLVKGPESGDADCTKIPGL